MKTRTKIVAFTFAMLLVGSLAYAADKRRQAKLAVDENDLISEEDALSAELQAATDDQQELPKTAAVRTTMGDDGIADVAKDIETAAEQ